MDNKKLAKTNGVVGLIGGVVLLLAPFILVAAIGMDVVGESTSNTSLLTIFTKAIKVASIVLGILGLINFKREPNVGSAPSILVLLGGVIGIIPMLGWIGGILLIIGGSLNLGSINKIENQSN